MRVVRILNEKGRPLNAYGLQSRLAEQFGVSRQRIHQIFKEMQLR